MWSYLSVLSLTLLLLVTTGNENKTRRKSRIMSTVRKPNLTVKQKCEIAQRELDDLREELEKTRNETEKQYDTIKNALEENEEQ